jgi:hypothetical protein
VFYGWLRLLIAMDKGEVIWAIAFVIAVGTFTGSAIATLVAAALALAALIALHTLNYTPRPQTTADPDAVVRPELFAAAVCAVVAAGFYALGLFNYSLGIGLFALIAWLAIAVSRPRRS